MANHFTYCYPPVDYLRNGVRVTEIYVTEGDAVRHAVSAVVRTIEFLRAVYCGPNAAPGRVRPDFVSAAAPMAIPGGADVDLARPAAVPSERALCDVDHGASEAPPPHVLRQIDAAVRAVAALPWTHVMPGSPDPTASRLGSRRDLRAPPATAAPPTCAPFVLRVQLAKATTGLFGMKRQPELLEEWEFRFVKQRLHGTPLPEPPVLSASSNGPLPATSTAPLNHALGLYPNTYCSNDKGKLRDVLHFVHSKALEAIDTYLADELKAVPELSFTVAVARSPTTQCLPAASAEPSAAVPPPGAAPEGGLMSNLSAMWGRA